MTQPTPIRATIVGLNRLGASLAMALHARDEIHVTGYDRNPDLGRLAQARGGLQHTEWRLLKAVAGADLVVLANPLVDQRDTLTAILPELRDGVVILSLSALLGPPLAWAGELLPAGGRRHFVACHPILNPAQLHSTDTGLEAARADLYQGGLWALAAAPGCAPEALRLAADLALVLEARPYFVDHAEHDGLAAATEALPAILSWALFQAAEASPGWPETRKVAERSFATATAALAEVEPAALLHNRENVLRYLDAALEGLTRFRGWLAHERQDVSAPHALEAAAEQRAAWLEQRQRGEWDAPGSALDELPSAGSEMGRMLLGGMFRRKGKDEA